MSGLTTGELVGLFDPITKAAIGVIDASGKEQIGLGGTAVGDASGVAKGILQFGGALAGSTATSQTVFAASTATSLEATLAAVRGSGGVGQIKIAAMSAPVSVTTSNIKSAFFTIPAGAMGPRGAVRLTFSVAKIGAVELVALSVRFGTAAFAFSGGTLAQSMNTGTAVGSLQFECWVYANGVDSTTILTTNVGIPVFTTTSPSFAPQTSLALSHDTTPFELAIGGNSGATTATWIVTNAQCVIYNPDAIAGGGSTTLAALTDVTFGTPANGNVLTYNTGTGKAIWAAPSGTVATNWQTVTPNVNGTTPVALNWASGPNIKITAIPGAAQPVSVILNVPDGADFQINLDNGGLSGLWTTYSTGAPTTAGYVWMGGGGAVATTGDALLTIPIFGKRDGFVYYVQAGYPVPKP
jgi:hypothetical protein